MGSMGDGPGSEDTTMADMQRNATSVQDFAEHEHRDLVRGINRIHDVACHVGAVSRTELSVQLIDVLHWFDSTLEPHIAWEEAWLYPEIDTRTGSPWATRAARFDHRQLRAVLAEVRADQASLHNVEMGEHHSETRCHLFSLVALVRAHIEREERFLMPILGEAG